MDQIHEPATVLFDGASIVLEVNNAPGEYDPRRANSVEITVEQAYGLIGQLRAAVSLAEPRRKTEQSGSVNVSQRMGTVEAGSTIVGYIARDL